MSGLILLTTDAVGGVWHYSCDLARAWQASGIACTLAVFGPAPGEAARADAFGLDIIETGQPLDWTAASPRALREAAATVATLARERGARAIHLHSAALAPPAAPAPVVAVIHSCSTTWWQTVRGAGPLPTDCTWRAQAIDNGMRRADAIIVPTEAFAMQVRRTYGQAHMHTVHNGVDPVPHRPPRENFVLAAGRLWDEGKNMAMLDEAVAGTAVDLRLAGARTAPHGAAFVPRHAQALGALPRAALRELAARAALFAAPALYEPFGLAVLEAAQAGTPLLLADIPTFRELWNDAALFLPPRDPAAWRDAMLALLRDAPARAALGARACAHAARYGVARMAERTLAVHALAARGRARHAA